MLQTRNKADCFDFLFFFGEISNCTFFRAKKWENTNPKCFDIHGFHADFSFAKRLANACQTFGKHLANVWQMEYDTLLVLA